MERNPHCAACHLPSAYNRAVVDVVAGDYVGSLCTGCIDDFFGRTLDAYECDGPGCVFCDRDGFYALPAWQPVTSQDATAVVVDGHEYDVADHTPRLCDRHFDDLRSHGDEDVTADRPSARRRSS